MSNLDQKQLLTIKEVTSLLGVGTSTVWRQLKLGKFPEPIKIGRSTRWRKSDIEAIYLPESDHEAA